MLGSVHDADDALQDALLRAWRGLEKFEQRSSLRSWLYRITTNACLDVISRRPKRVLPFDHGPAAGPGEGLADPHRVRVDRALRGCAARDRGRLRGARGPFRAKESVELAFIAALQHLPASQRAVLILRDVLGFSAREAADPLGEPSRRSTARCDGRKAATERLPDRTQITLRELGDERIRDLAQRYIDAWERSDIDAILALLAEDATFTMPPLPTWYRGRDAIAAFLGSRRAPGSVAFALARANGQLAFGCYAWDAEQELHGAVARRAHPGWPAGDGGHLICHPAQPRSGPRPFATDVLERFGLAGLGLTDLAHARGAIVAPTRARMPGSPRGRPRTCSPSASDSRALARGSVGVDG